MSYQEDVHFFRSIASAVIIAVILLQGCLPPLVMRDTSLTCQGMSMDPYASQPDPRRKICFTRAEYAQIAKMKARCKRWPKECKMRIKEAIETYGIDLRRQVKQAYNAYDTCEKKRQVCVKMKTRCSWVGPIFIGIGIGVVVGVIGSVIMVVSVGGK